MMGIADLSTSFFSVTIHKNLLADEINHVVTDMVFPHFLSWTWADVSFSPILLVGLAATIFILIYLYITSELISKKVLTWLLVIVIFFFIFINVHIYVKNRAPGVKFRLSFIAIECEPGLENINWIGEALWADVVRKLHFSVGDRAIVSPAEWTREIVASDSIQNLNYLRKINYQVRADYLLVGKISSHSLQTILTYQVIATADGQVVIDRSLPLTTQNIPETSSKVCQDLLDYFNIESILPETAIRYTSSRAYEKYFAGEEYYQQKKYQAAAILAQQAIAADSGIVEAYLLAGKCFFMNGVSKMKKGDSPIEEFQHAKQWLNWAVALDSSCDEAYSFLGEYYIYRERWSLAEQMLNKAYRLNPNNPRLYLALSRLNEFRFQKLGFTGEEQLFKRAIFINPCYEDAYLMLADYYLFNNERKRALQVLKEILDLKPNSVPVLMALGKIYLVRNDILKIIEIYNKVLELEPNNSDAYYNLGILYYNSKDYENAEKFLRRAIAIDNHLNAHLYLAYVYEINNNYDKAIEQLRKRIHYRKGLDDEFAEEARKHLFKLLHRDSVPTGVGEK